MILPCLDWAFSKGFKTKNPAEAGSVGDIDLSSNQIVTFIQNFIDE